MNRSITDGRAKRSARSRQQIIDAMVSLINENSTMPTAQQVADEAGLAIRTVFRHFSEMEKLYAELDAAMAPTYEQLFVGGDRDGTLAERVRHAVEQHAAAYSQLANLIRGVMELYWSSPALRKNYSRHQRNLRKDLEDWLPELKKVSPETRETIDAITSFEFWDRLQVHQGLGKKVSITLITNLVLKLV